MPLRHTPYDASNPNRIRRRPAAGATLNQPPPTPPSTHCNRQTMMEPPYHQRQNNLAASPPASYENTVGQTMRHPTQNNHHHRRRLHHSNSSVASSPVQHNTVIGQSTVHPPDHEQQYILKASLPLSYDYTFEQIMMQPSYNHNQRHCSLSNGLAACPPIPHDTPVGQTMMEPSYHHLQNSPVASPPALYDNDVGQIMMQPPHQYVLNSSAASPLALYDDSIGGGLSRNGTRVPAGQVTTLPQYQSRPTSLGDQVGQNASEGETFQTRNHSSFGPYPSPHTAFERPSGHNGAYGESPQIGERSNTGRQLSPQILVEGLSGYGGAHGGAVQGLIRPANQPYPSTFAIWEEPSRSDGAYGDTSHTPRHLNAPPPPPPPPSVTREMSLGCVEGYEGPSRVIENAITRTYPLLHAVPEGFPVQSGGYGSNPQIGRHPSTGQHCSPGHSQANRGRSNVWNRGSHRTRIYPPIQRGQLQHPARGSPSMNEASYGEIMAHARAHKPPPGTSYDSPCPPVEGSPFYDATNSGSLPETENSSPVDRVSFVALSNHNAEKRGRVGMQISRQIDTSIYAQRMGGVHMQRTHHRAQSITASSMNAGFASALMVAPAAGPNMPEGLTMPPHSDLGLVPLPISQHHPSITDYNYCQDMGIPDHAWDLPLTDLDTISGVDAHVPTGLFEIGPPVTANVAARWVDSVNALCMEVTEPDWKRVANLF